MASTRLLGKTANHFKLLFIILVLENTNSILKLGQLILRIVFNVLQIIAPTFQLVQIVLYPLIDPVLELYFLVESFIHKLEVGAYEIQYTVVIFLHHLMESIDFDSENFLLLSEFVDFLNCNIQ